MRVHDSLTSNMLMGSLIEGWISTLASEITRVTRLDLIHERSLPAILQVLPETRDLSSVAHSPAHTHDDSDQCTLLLRLGTVHKWNQLTRRKSMIFHSAQCKIRMSLKRVGKKYWRWNQPNSTNTEGYLDDTQASIIITWATVEPVHIVLRIKMW